jgi:hypothetical protein
VKEILIGIASASGGALVVYLGGRIRHALSRRVKVTSPESEAIEKMAPALNAMLAIQRPVLDVVVALGEKDLGKDDVRVAKAKGAAEAFNTFLDGAA